MSKNSWHITHAVVTFSLLLTGLLLYSQSIRGTLADLRIYLHYAHIILGVIFALTIVTYVRLLVMNWDRCAGQNTRKSLNVLFIALAAGSFLTGILLVLRTSPEVAAGLSVLSLHRGLAAIGSVAVLYHTLSRLLQPKTLTPDGNACSDIDEGFLSNRRVFIRWAAAVGVLVGGGALAKWLGAREISSTTPVANASQFKNCNSMTPQPLPNLGSVPPVGGGYKGEFEVFTVTKIPCVSSDNWQFRLFGLVDNPLTLSWKEFLEIPRKVQVSDFYCITGWTVYNGTYEGIPLSRFLALGKVKPEAGYVKFYSGDGVYTSALSMEQAKMEDVMVAVLIDGKPIPSDLGGPARLIVPQMYAYKGVKWVNGIELVQKPHIGYWESRGYDNDAWVK